MIRKNDCPTALGIFLAIVIVVIIGSAIKEESRPRLKLGQLVLENEVRINSLRGAHG